MHRLRTACTCGGTITRGACDRCGPIRPESADKRPSAARRGYDRAWQQLRAHTLATHPWCADCDQAGIVTESTEVHHLQPIAEAPNRRLDPSNLMALCKSCHSRRTAAEEGNAGDGKQCTVVRFTDRDRALHLVRSRKSPGDLVFDFDAICSTIGAGSFPRPVDVAQLVTAWRRDLCERIRSGQLKRRAWILTSDPKAAQAIARTTRGAIAQA